MSAYKKFVEVCIRSTQSTHAIDDRTGMTSLFTSSKAYSALPIAYSPDSHVGIPTGDIFVEGKLTGPHDRACDTRAVIRACIWHEKKAVTPYVQALFDHGNKFEPVAIAFFLKLFPHIEYHESQRIVCEDPRWPWMGATPDGILYDHKAHRAYCLEVKTTGKRKLVHTEQPTVVHGDFAHDTNVRDPELNQDVLVKDKKYPHVLLYRNTKIPDCYAMQFLLECISTGIHDLLCVQFQAGTAYAPPVVCVTEYHFDHELFDIMQEYWSAVWRYVEEGRKHMLKYKEEHARLEKEGMDTTYLASNYQAWKANYPWPLREKGTPDSHCIRLMPNIFDKCRALKAKRDAEEMKAMAC